MKIKTKIQVNYNDGILGTKNDFVTGVINTINIRSDFKLFIISYTYSDSEGNEIKNSSYSLTDVEANNLYQSIKADLPANFSDLTEKEQLMYKYYNGFIQIMSQTFNIDKTDIEIIV
jgi:hypothetical protein